MTVTDNVIKSDAFQALDDVSSGDLSADLTSKVVQRTDSLSQQRRPGEAKTWTGG